MNSILGQTIGALTASLIVPLISNRTQLHTGEMMAANKADMFNMSTEAIEKLKETISLEAFVAGDNDGFMFYIVIAGIALK